MNDGVEILPSVTVSVDPVAELTNNFSLETVIVAVIGSGSEADDMHFV